MRLIHLAAAAAVAIVPMLAVPAQAQQQGIAPSEATLPPLPKDTEVVMRARIASINPQTREVGLQPVAGGATTVVKAGPAIRLEMLKVGDQVDARYIRSTTLMTSQPGTKVPPNMVDAAAARPMTAPGGVAVMATRISAIVVGINVAANQISVVDPTGGAVYAVDVTDPEHQKALPKLKIGERITAVVTESLAVSIVPAT
jgi:hypothetical protein